MKTILLIAMLLATGCATSGQLQQANMQIEALSARVQVLEQQQAHTRIAIQGIIQYLKDDVED